MAFISYGYIGGSNNHHNTLQSWIVILTVVHYTVYIINYCPFLLALIMQLPQQNKAFTAMNMYHSPKKFNKYIVQKLTYNDKKTYTLQQWTHGDIYTMIATFRSLSNICTQRS